jgi:hypothetical protein
LSAEEVTSDQQPRPTRSTTTFDQSPHERPG